MKLVKIKKLGENVLGGIYKGEKTFISNCPITDNTLVLLNNKLEIIGVMYGIIEIFQGDIKYRAWHFIIFENERCYSLEFDVTKKKEKIFGNLVLYKNKLESLIKKIK